MKMQTSFTGAPARGKLWGSVSMAAIAATLLPAGAALAQSTSSEPVATVGEVVVTASRRSETVANLPLNISAYGGEALKRSNITSVAGLTQQVPNFVIEDRGARSSASAIPIIRGLNASQPVVASARYFQSPVGFYLGNTPITGSIPIFDVERIEVLRGPQGTLYGAGALSGAVRIVPIDPRIGEYEGFVTGSASAVSHSGELSNSIAGAVNIPLGDTVAIRINARRQYDAGFIDQNDILKRAGDNYTSGAPVLANPADVAGSPAVYFNQKDVNDATTSSARVALTWRPTEALTVDAAYNYAKSEGNGGPVDNNSYRGGVSPLDPRRTLVGTGDFERSSPTLEPFSRETHLASLDVSYDLGFATLSTTLAYGKTEGEATADSTLNLLGSPYGYYYTGTPANPRVVIPVYNPDTDRSYTQEIRLVSNSGERFDYILGAFFQQQKRSIGLHVFAPGADVQTAAAHGGSRVPIALGGTFVPVFADNSSYNQEADQTFKDYSAYGELTWHVNDQWQVTGGARFFKQKFSQSLFAESSFFFFTVDESTKSEDTSQIFKLNTSYKWNESNQVYATWSQGYRRGGANAFALAGPVREPRELITYEADQTNNFELGAKGRFQGLYYSANVFFIQWDKPQIDLATPYILTPVVVNGSEAESKGAEFEISGPIGPQGLSFSLGLAYAKARLTEDFNLPAGDGAGGIVPNAIRGRSGDRLPGAPDYSGSARINYETDVFDDATLTYALGVDFRSSTVNQLPSLSTNSPTRQAPAYALLNGSIAFERDDWQVELFGTNLADSRVKLSSNVRSQSSYRLLGDWANTYAVARPREIGVRVTRRW